MTSHTDLLTQAAALLREAIAMPTVGLSDQQAGEVLIATETAGRLLDGLRAITAADINDRCRYELGAEAMCHKFGHTRTIPFLEYLIRIPAADARRRIRLGTQILPTVGITGQVLPPKQPLLAAAVVDGVIGVETAAHLARLVKRAESSTDTEVLDTVITDLVEQGSFLSPDLVAVQVTQWETVLDADGLEPRAEAMHTRRAFRLGKESFGMTPFSGLLEPLDAGLLKAMFTDADAATGPRFLSDEDRVNGTMTTLHEDGSETTVDRDTRTPEQRNADIVLGTLKAGLRASAKETGGMRPTTTVSIVVTLDDLKNTTGAGWVDQVAEPLAITTVQQALCDAQSQQVLLGTFGEVLYLGPLVRLFSDAQKRALAVRDGSTCVWDCATPARQCDAHHVIEHSKGGSTDIDNALLLCSAHHHMLHASGYTIRMVNGVPFLQAPLWVDPAGTWRPMGKARTAHPTLSAFDGTAVSSLPVPPSVFVIPNKVAGMPSTRNRSIESDATLETVTEAPMVVPPRGKMIPNPIAGMPSTRETFIAPEATPVAAEAGWYVEGADDTDTSGTSLGCSIRVTGGPISEPKKRPVARRPVRPTISFGDLARPQSPAQRRQLITAFSTPPPPPPERQ